MRLKEFIKKAATCRIDVSRVSRQGVAKGVCLMVISWQLIAYGVVTHVLPKNSWLARFVDFSMQMLLCTLFLLLLSIFMGLFLGKGLKGYRRLKITRKNEDIKYGQGRHLSYEWRIGAIYARAALATSGYFLFELARVFLNVIDNSAIFGADALVYALMFGWWLDKKIHRVKVYSRSEWIGMAISASAVVFAIVYESLMKSPILALEGIGIGLSSAMMLASLILISSIIVYHDSVIRIAFHNCLFGFLLSLILITINIHINYNGNYSEVMNILQQTNLKSTAIFAITYALALLGFLQSYKYIESVLIAMLGNSLALGTLLMTFLLQSDHINSKNILITTLLIVGSIILGVSEWKKAHKKTNKTSH